MSVVFVFLGPVGQDEGLVVPLPGAVLMELSRIAFCVPRAATNLQASFLPHLYASDASRYAWVPCEHLSTSPSTGSYGDIGIDEVVTRGSTDSGPSGCAWLAWMT